MLLVLPTTSVLKRREVPPSVSSFSVSATTISTFLCVYSIAVAAVKKGYAFFFFGRGAAAYNISTEAERGAGYCFFLLRSVLYTAMLRTSIAAVVLGCLYFCLLDCDIPVMIVDCAAVETGCMLEKYKMVAHLQCYNKKRGYIRTWYVYKLFFFIFRLMRYTDVCFFSLSGVLFPRE